MKKHDIKDSVHRRIYDFFVKNWLFSAIIASLSSTWFSIVRFTRPLGVVDYDNQLTLLGHFVTWPIFFISLLFIVSKSYADKINERSKSDGFFVFRRLLQCVNSVTKFKLDRFCDFIHKNHQNPDVFAFQSITQPKVQIRSILENIQNALSEIFAIEKDDISLCILCKNDDDWAFLAKINISNSLSVKELTTNPQSTVYKLIHSDDKSIFYPNKAIAIKDNSYVPSGKDRDFENTGSVFICDMSIVDARGENKIFPTILCISTFGRQLCDENDINSILKIKNKIIPVFEPRIKLETASFYIKEVLVTKCLECTNKLKYNSSALDGENDVLS